jgi:hypothetical protein
VGTLPERLPQGEPQSFGPSPCDRATWDMFVAGSFALVTQESVIGICCTSFVWNMPSGP